MDKLEEEYLVSLELCIEDLEIHKRQCLAEGAHHRKMAELSDEQLAACMARIKKDNEFLELTRTEYAKRK